jgi:XTP/dITP diphosphohydrolase
MDILLASQNQHKLKEIQKIVNDPNINIISLLDLNDNDEVLEDGQTFHENAYLKAKYFYDKYHMPVISDDSGLVVDALGGKPGIYSARYSGTDANALTNNLKLLDEMKNIDKREARFVCTICFIANDEVQYFDGRLEGKIAYDIKGHKGFGYDPIFILKEGLRLSELSIVDKNKISHRALALKKWSELIKNGSL